MNNESERPKVKVDRSNTEKFLEIFSAAILLSMWGYMILFWDHIPLIIPKHFNFWGRPDAWGRKSGMIGLLVIASVLYFFLTVLSFFPKYYNYSVKITEENAERQYGNARSMMTWMKVEILGILAYLEAESVKIAIYKLNGLSLWFLPIFLVTIFGTIAVFIRRMYRLR